MKPINIWIKAANGCERWEDVDGLFPAAGSGCEGATGGILLGGASICSSSGSPPEGASPSFSKNVEIASYNPNIQ